MKDNLKRNSKETPPRFSERRFRLSKDLPSQKFRREEKCEREQSGLPFAFHHPPQRQNCKIMLQNLILQFGKQLDEKAQRDFFDKLLCLFPAVDSDALCPLRGVKQGEERHGFAPFPDGGAGGQGTAARP